MYAKNQLNKPKRGAFAYIRNQIKYSLNWYLDRITLHGFNHVTNKYASTFTRLFFLCISCCSFVLCSYLVVLQIEEYQNQVLITKVDTTTYPVWNFRFPSVTVCNFNVVYKDNIKKLLQVATSHGINEEVFADFVKNLSFLVAYDDNVYNSSDFKEVYAVLRKNGYDIDRVMAQLAHPCHAMVKRCFWRAEEVPCSHIIQTVKTRHGYCCSFNYYGTRKIAHRIEDPHNLRHTYTGLAGVSYGLQLLLDVDIDQYVSSLIPAYGINVLVQDGAEYLNLNYKITNTLRVGEELKISITPSVYVSTKNVRNLKVEQRKCLFEDEGHLEWSSIYSYRTCVNQCRARAIFKFCKCMPFYFPFENFTRLCTLSDVHCLQINRFNYAAVDISKEMILDDDDEEEKHNNQEQKSIYIYCPCYAQCDENIFDFRTFTLKTSSLTGFERSNLSLLKVYYNDVDCFRIEKDVSYTWYNILSEIGGLFSLCLGASVISVLECSYLVGKLTSKCSNIKSCTEKASESPETYFNTYQIYNFDNNMEKAYSRAINMPIKLYERQHAELQKSQNTKF